MSAPPLTAATPLPPREALISAMGKGEIRRVLVVRFARLGDVVFTLPAVEAVSEALPAARIDYLTSGGARDLVAPHPAISEVFLYEAGWHHLRKRARRAALVEALRERGYDLVLVFESDQPTRDLLERLAREAGVPHVVSRSSFVPPADDRPAQHSCEKHLRLLTMLGLEPAHRPYALHVADADRERVDRWLEGHGVEKAGAPPLVGIQAGCHYSRVPAWLLRRIGLRHKFHKAWPYTRWSDVGSRLADELGARVVLTGAAGERRIAEGIAREIRAPRGLEPIVAAGETSVGMLAALIERTKLFLSIDTGTMHIATALGVPTVALFGPTDPSHHGPYGAGDSTFVLTSGAACSPCKKRERKACRVNVCMTDLTAERVVAAGHALLARQARV